MDTTERNVTDGDVPAGDVDDPRALRSLPVLTLGVTAVAGACLLFVRMIGGFSRARGAIADHASTHGPLQIENGVLVHDGPATRALCETVAGHAGFVYPFGELVFTGPPLLALIGMLLIWRNGLPVIPTVAAFAASVAAPVWAATAMGDVLAVLE